MLFQAFRALAFQLLVIMALILTCALITLAVDGREAAESLVTLSISGMWAPAVWTLGWGLETFVRREGRGAPNTLTNVLENGPISHDLAASLDRSTRHRSALPYTLFTSAVGVVLTFAYALPVDGIGRIFVFVAVVSIYYVAGFLLFHFVQVTAAFNRVYLRLSEVRFRTVYDPMSLEAFTTYLAITSTLGVVAIYAGFRGTVTAGFLFPSEAWRPFLLTPIVLFLPATLLYNYYPRYVLRKAVHHRVFEAMARLGESLSTDDTRGLMLDLREAGAISSQILPFVDYKSLPSYLLAVFFGVSLVLQGDPAVRDFIQRLLGF